MDVSVSRHDAAEPVAFTDALRVWLRIGLLSFGGPAAQIALMHRVVVDERRWLTERQFLNALSFCMLLPGPEAMQLATYTGWHLHGTRGGIAAGLLFVLPGALIVLALAMIYAGFGDAPALEALFYGIKAAVLVIVFEALLRIGKRALAGREQWAIAALSFIGIFFLALPFPLIVLAAGIGGYVGGRLGLSAFKGGGGHGPAGAEIIHDRDTALGEGLPDHARPNLSWSLRISGVLLLLWLGPVAALLFAFGPDDVFSRIATFFSQMAVVTFGGAYAVLAYVAQEAVETYGWLQPGEMLDGLGMAETTPGPLIMVLQFVGFLGAFRDAGWESSLLAGTLGGLLATWVTFAPCFAWIFLGAPFMEGLRSNRALSAALTAVTAAVVGVILNLAIWFAIHVVWREVFRIEAGPLSIEVPRLASIDWAAAALSALALVAVFRLKLGMAAVIGGAALLGIALHFAGAA